MVKCLLDGNMSAKGVLVIRRMYGLQHKWFAVQTASHSGEVQGLEKLPHMWGSAPRVGDVGEPDQRAQLKLAGAQVEARQQQGRAT